MACAVDPALRRGAWHPFVFGRTGLWHHHRRRGHGAVADKRHCLFALHRRAGAGRLLGCLVAVQSQRGASQSAQPRQRHGPEGLHGLPFDTTTDSEGVSDKSTGTVQLSSSQFAVVEKSHKCTLVPWRPVINRQLSSEVCAGR
ncbi:DUF3363 domain-containing protein [Pseudomonas aeruginosa]|nr:DUF3363 domain-containing protein [Pseudomonas aeruginosa]HBO3718727.1 DUF3363 domain-containing protein [Pseudomonas aeruginosa]HCF1072290.1 DUF3363 domain-containing protein [Pseudomonas aeruginosa]